MISFWDDRGFLKEGVKTQQRLLKDYGMYLTAVLYDHFDAFNSTQE
jgi:hypothetical protein